MAKEIQANEKDRRRKAGFDRVTREQSGGLGVSYIMTPEESRKMALIRRLRGY
jgi:hypothetical protein